MRIAVCLKQVLARDWQPRIDDSGTWVVEQGATYELNEPDACALEEALRLTERHGGEVVACSAGPARSAQVIREALARGADRGIHILHDQLARADAFGVAHALSTALSSESFDLILTGLQSEDQGFAQTGVILAELLGHPHATLVTEVGVEGETIRVRRELEGGWFQWVGLPLPAVLTIQSGINQLRYATLKGIMGARKKEIRIVAPESLAPPHQTILRLSAPERTKKLDLLTGSATDAAAALVRKLRDEARVLD